LNVEDLRRGARRRLPKSIFEFMDRGAEDETTLRENFASFQRVKLRTRILCNVSTRDQSTVLFGKPSSMPVAIAPMGVAGLVWYEGELELARAAARSGVPFTLATPSISSIESVARVEGGAKWFQHYPWRDRNASHQLVRRAQDAGYEALIVTADSPVPPIREYNQRNGFSTRFRFNLRIAVDIACSPSWSAHVLAPYLLKTGLPSPVHYPPADLDAASGFTVDERTRCDDITWDDIGRLREMWRGPLLLKGLNRPDDAARARQAGVDGLVVSTHGGRNLDGGVASLDVLAEVAEAAGPSVLMILDSGIRRGGDILKALALGADAVLVGRPALYGTSVAGERGAVHALGLLSQELDVAMAHTGCRTVSEVSNDILWRPIHEDFRHPAI
jgi:isopentenyl diphosphate isomerase/L-lactate dehydrogenase-like FMN-dependent dehydrogenase